MKITPNHVFWTLLILCILAFCWRVYAEVNNQPVCGNHCWYDMRGKNLKEWKLEDHIKPVSAKPAQTVIKAQNKPVEQRKEVKPTNDTFDLDKFARAVACHETKCGTKGSAVSHNNAFGIMTWDKNGKRSFKRYEKIEDSYTDFKRIWSSFYGGFPTLKQAKRYSGNDRSEIWLYNVKFFYEKDGNK